MRLAVYDLYRKVREGAESTVTGGFLSVLGVALIVVLGIAETVSFLGAPKSMAVEVDRNMDESLQVNLDILLMRMPCNMVSLETWDYTGTSQLRHEDLSTKYVVFGDQGEFNLGEAGVMGHLEHMKNEHLLEQVTHEAAEELVDANFASKLNKEPLAIVKFYTPWCIWCQRLVPHFAALPDALAQVGLPGTKLFKVNCVENLESCRGIAGFPTVRYFVKGKPQTPDYRGDRTAQDMAQWVANGVKKVDSASGETNKFVVRKQAHGTVMRRVADENLPEGCRIIGALKVSRVPSNIHIVAAATTFDINPREVNLSHRVNIFSFGSMMSPQRLLRLPIFAQYNVNPFNGQTFVATEKHILFDHYLKVVTTRFARHRGKRAWSLDDALQDRRAYLVTASTKSTIADPNVPEIRFSYDFSPFATVVFQKTDKTWYDYLTNLCALIGGVWTILQLVDSTLFNLVHSKIKTMQGKLG
ncbi:Protein disulfide isomerase-like 5-4 [Porphyridium purpureum]|uniref:Protein disulfide isomerase-like 5-4 n=1 Tax=Porphyridium purpureum TaxID=35688 RepID=A0A5J4Z3T6_PORPP|nr:Protein disulfide isomerase-like 5-4 [Porphyridium purpureum]|eukprot:POR1984..scf295_1